VDLFCRKKLERFNRAFIVLGKTTFIEATGHEVDKFGDKVGHNSANEQSMIQHMADSRLIHTRTMLVGSKPIPTCLPSLKDRRARVQRAL
jgi:hypothetical protein